MKKNFGLVRIFGSVPFEGCWFAVLDWKNEAIVPVDFEGMVEHLKSQRATREEVIFCEERKDEFGDDLKTKILNALPQ